jgi:hypothetical protein
LEEWERSVTKKQAVGAMPWGWLICEQRLGRAMGGG